MNFKILRKDLKRKKSMNLILLLFVLLATTFIAASLNNLKIVTNGLDYYFEKAGLSDFFIVAMSGAGGEKTENDAAIEDFLKEQKNVTKYDADTCLMVMQNQIEEIGDAQMDTNNAVVVSGIERNGQKFFDENNQEIDEEKKQEIAGHIDEKVDEIEGYISEIVRASNEDFLHFDVQNGEFYIKDVLEQIREYYADKMKLNQIDFAMPEYRNCLVYGDADRLVEVLQNIMENAIKYGNGKRIWLETEREEEEYIIRISNTGCQLEDKELPHIFDSFFRGSNVEKKPGSGLGLFICRQLMHLMEGEIIASVKPAGEDAVITLQVAVRMA